ncbi:hypothetical protein [Ruegeria sp. 6PALISEP08]|uniref:hypothetical protein n=1 Tax=Ruegeria sp. 6PALISEP08 TaxID=1225660 RepID=UPI00155DA01D|nr:hypothetical protein [Ruegeria sp. 6PALISEP08]
MATVVNGLKLNFRRYVSDPHFLLTIGLKAANDLAFFLAVGGSQQIEATILVYLYPISNMLIAGFVLGDSYERLTPAHWILVAIAGCSIFAITPLTGTNAMEWSIVFLALLSALSSAYVVTLQSAADRLSADNNDERALILLLFLGSTLLQIIYVLISGHDLKIDEALSSEQLWMFVLGVGWISIFVNIASEKLWLRASREYQGISLKSLFFLSPVLGAIYFVLLGLDTVNSAMVFSLTIVVTVNLLLHNKDIEELSFLILIFSFVGLTVVREMLPETTNFSSFVASPFVLDSQIAIISILIGFILLRAFEVYTKSIDALVKLLEVMVEFARKKNPGMLPELETQFMHLLQAPDVAYWENKKYRSFKDAVASPEVAATYMHFFKLRFASTSYAEYFLCFLICYSMLPFILGYSLRSDGSGFLGVLISSICIFLPFFILELTTLRMAQPYLGLLLRRVAWLQFSAAGEDVPMYFVPRQRFKRARFKRALSMAGIVMLVAIVSWNFLAN